MSKHGSYYYHYVNKELKTKSSGLDLQPIFKYPHYTILNPMGNFALLLDYAKHNTLIFRMLHILFSALPGVIVGKIVEIIGKLKKNTKIIILFSNSFKATSMSSKHIVTKI